METLANFNVRRADVRLDSSVDFASLATVVQFQYNWKIPRYPDVFTYTQPGNYIISEPVEVGDATFSIIFYPKGKKERSGEYAEVYFRLDALRRNAQTAICYYYGLLSSNDAIEQRMYVDKCAIELGYLSPRSPGLWMESKIPFLKEEYLHQDNMLVLYFKGTVSFEREGQSKMTIPAVNKDASQLMVARDLAKISSVSTALLKLKSESEENVIEILKRYPKWSQLILESDCMLKAVYHTYNLDQLLAGSESIYVNSRNVAGVLLASDICEDKDMKYSCFKFIKHQGASLMRSYNIMMLKTYVPDLYDEMIAEVRTVKKPEDVLNQQEEDEESSFGGVRNFFWTCMLCCLFLFVLFYFYALIVVPGGNVERNGTAEVEREPPFHDPRIYREV